MFRRSIPLYFLVLFLLSPPQPARAQDGDAEHLFARGLTWQQFLDGAKAQRDVWLKTTSSVHVPQELVDRFRRVGSDLRILIVAEDWCPDSVNAVPHIAGFAAALPVPLRIVDRGVGDPLMKRHRTPDGRIATPTVVLMRGVSEIGAWVERPSVVQAWFLSMATSPESAKRFEDRQSWYDSDRGRSVLAELTDLAERTAVRK